MTSSHIPNSKKYTLFIFFKRRFMQLSLMLSGVLLITLLPYKTSESASPSIRPAATHEITLLFAGDIMQHMPQVEAAWNDKLGIYIYDSCFKYITPWLSGADLTIANLETTLAGKPFSGYPAFSSPDELVTGMLNAGIDIVGTANNHCCDRGRTGIERTVSILDSLGMMHMGSYKNAETYRRSNPMIVNTRGFRLAFVNYTYGTNNNPVPENNVVSLIEKDRLLADMKAAHDSAVDMTIVFIHWGIEYQRAPNDFQKDIAATLFANGADIIIGSHPHVIQPMEWRRNDSLKKEQLVVWSLGNFVSNQRKQYTDGGTMFRITLQKESGHARIKDAGYQLTWVYNPIKDGKKQYYILPAAHYENDTILLDKLSQAELKVFLNDSRELLNSSNVMVKEFK
jgi:poly-gamma-glutamate capsule biosynthesis protein CapA/YwtB (metallophosphatase superfamily)